MKLKKYIKQGRQEVRTHNAAMIKKWEFLVTPAGREEIKDQFDMAIGGKVNLTKRKNDGNLEKSITNPWPKNEVMGLGKVPAEILEHIDKLDKPALCYDLANTTKDFGYYTITPDSRKVAKVVLGIIIDILADHQQAEFSKALEKAKAAKSKI